MADLRDLYRFDQKLSLGVFNQVFRKTTKASKAIRPCEFSEVGLNRFKREITLESKVYVAALAVVLTSMIAYKGISELFENHKIDKMFQVPQEWPQSAAITLRQAAKADAGDDEDRATELYEKLIDILTTASSTEQSAEWLAAYSNVLFRLSHLYFLKGRYSEARASLIASSEIPFGNVKWKCDALFALANEPVFLETSTQKERENYLRKILEYVLPAETCAKMAANSRCDLIYPANTIIQSVACESLMALAVLQVKEHKLQEALNTLLGTLRGVRYTVEKLESENEQSVHVCREGIILLYISEILWALNHHEDAIAWAKASFLQTYPSSRADTSCLECAQTGAKNLAHMFKTIGQFDLSKKYQTLELMCERPERSPAGFSYAWEASG